MNENQILSSLAKLIANSSENHTQTTFANAFDNYINYSITRCRADTINYYKKHFKTISMYYLSQNIFFIEEVNKINLNKYIAYCKNIRQVKNATINKSIGILKQTIKYNYDNKITNVNEIATFKKLPIDEVNIKIVDLENIVKIFNYLKNQDLEEFSTLRNVVFLMLVKDTGARINEVRNIQLSLIDINENTIFLSFTKTKKTRKVFFTNDTKQYLLKLIKIIKSRKLDYIFVNTNDDNIIHKNTIYRFISNIQKNLKIEQSISPHKWRHTLATNLIDKCNIEIVRNVLGHSTIEMTKRYLHINDDTIKKSVLNALNQDI